MGFDINDWRRMTPGEQRAYGAKQKAPHRVKWEYDPEWGGKRLVCSTCGMGGPEQYVKDWPYCPYCWGKVVGVRHVWE